MKKYLFGRRSWSLALAIGAMAILPAQAGAATTSASLRAVDTSFCSTPAFFQPFSAWHDTHWYTLMPGESIDSFDGTGWTLTGGAKIATTTLANGRTSSVLDLPSGASAVSPVMCVTTDYPRARSMVRDVVGAEGVSFYVAYDGTKTWTTPQVTGTVHGKGTAWTLSDPVGLHPTKLTGWQAVRFKLVGGGKTSDFQVYDFYVDPRCRF